MMSAKEMFEEQRYKRNEENENITYLQRFGSGYFRITFDLSKEAIAIDTNMGNVIESDLLQAIIQQVKELHWLKQTHEKPVYKLTKFEKELLECYSDVYSFKVFNSLNGMKKIGYFKGIDDNELIGDILAKCEVVG